MCIRESSLKFLRVNAGETAVEYETISGGGDVTAASNIADNAIVIGDGGVKGVQESNVTITGGGDDITLPDGGSIVFPDATNGASLSNSDGTLVVSSTTTGQEMVFSVQPLDADRTDDVAVRVFSYASGGDAEFAQFGWSVDATTFYVGTFDINSGTPQPLALSAGTANLGSQFILNVDGTISVGGSVDFANASALRTGVTAADTLLLQAYDVNGTAYVTFATLTAGDTPTFEISESTTVASGGVVVGLTASQTLTNKTLTSPIINASTITGNQNVGAVPASDHTVNGPTTSIFNLGATIALMDLVYLGSSSKWLLTDADAASTAGGVLAICLDGGADTDPTTVALSGSFVRDDTWNWTPGATLYVDTATPGAITATAPSGTDDVIRVVGFAVTADVIYFNPSPDYITHV